jgi:hypothetical protein
MITKIKIILKQQDSIKKVSHALPHFLLIEEQIANSKKALFMALHLHLILFLKPLSNRNIMSLKIMMKA